MEQYRTIASGGMLRFNQSSQTVLHLASREIQRACNLMQRCKSDYAYINKRSEFLTARISRISSAYRTDVVIAKSVMKYRVSPSFRVCVNSNPPLSRTGFPFILLRAVEICHLRASLCLRQRKRSFLSRSIALVAGC